MSSVAVFIDLQKSIDTLNNEILLNNLCPYGISGIVLEWIVDYLINGKKFFIKMTFVQSIKQ